MFKTIEEIDAHYAALTQQAGDDTEKVASLRLERADKVVELRMAGVQTRERDIWKKAAVAQYPGAGELPELVTGDTEEAIQASAKAAHERVVALRGGVQPPSNTQEELRRAARDAYGANASGGGQPPQFSDADETFLMDFQDRYNLGREHPNFPTRQEVDRFTRLRGATHLSERVENWARQTRSNYGL